MSSYDILSKVNFSMIKIATNSFPRIVIQCFPFVHTNPGVVQFIMNKSSSRARVAIHSNRIVSVDYFAEDMSLPKTKENESPWRE